jgi:hypothetical protein
MSRYVCHLQPDRSVAEERESHITMIAQTHTDTDAAPLLDHELRFASLYQPGRGVTVPCDAGGRVDLDAMSDRMRVAYLGARALLGREYAHPIVQRVH